MLREVLSTIQLLLQTALQLILHSLLPPNHLETKQRTPLLPHRIDHKRAKEESDGNPNRDLNHRVPDIEHDTIQLRARSRHILHGRRSPRRRVSRDTIRARNATDQRATGRQATRDLYEDSGQEGRSRKTVSNATIHVTQNAHREGAKCITDLRILRKLGGREEIDEVPGKGDDEHDGGLFPFCLVDDDEAEGEGGDEGEGNVFGHLGGAGGGGGGVAVGEPVEGGSDRDAEADEERVDHCVDHADGAGDDGL